LFLLAPPEGAGTIVIADGDWRKTVTNNRCLFFGLKRSTESDYRWFNKYDCDGPFKDATFSLTGGYSLSSKQNDL